MGGSVTKNVSTGMSHGRQKIDTAKKKFNAESYPHLPATLAGESSGRLPAKQRRKK
jgi:hypothetical protein